MGVAIQCLLEGDVPGVPHLEGKVLLAAYCGDAGADAGMGEEGESENIIKIDFGGGKPAATQAEAKSDQALFRALDEFISDGQSVRWHDAGKGLVAVKGILAKLRKGAKMVISPDFGFADEDAGDLRDDVCGDLETLEQILHAAQKEQVRFCLAFDV